MKVKISIFVIFVLGIAFLITSKEKTIVEKPKEKKLYKIVKTKEIFKKSKSPKNIDLKVSSPDTKKPSKEKNRLEEVYQLSINKNVEDMSKEELLAHMVKPFGSGNIGKVDFKQARNIADRIIDMDETIYAAHKLKFIADWIELLSKKETSFDKISESLAGIKKFDYIEEDEQIGDAISIAYLQAKKSEELKKYSEELIESNPDSGKGHYYLSMYYQSIENPERSIESLNKALEAEPNNEKYQFALDSIKAGKKNSYKFSLTFDEDDF